MIKLFGITDTTFNSNGDKVIIPTKAKIHKEDNGEYKLDIETNLEYVNDLTANRIIVANTPNGDQPFRITNVDQTKTKITLKAKHVYYDTKNYLIKDSYVVDKDCNYALDYFNSNTDNPSPFTTSSDITTINTFRCVRKTLYEANNTILERWGGHIVRDGFTYSINNTIGTDNGVTVRYAKNIKDISVEYNWDNVVTKILPVGKDGLLLDEVYIYSTIQYAIPYTKTISFTQDTIVQDNYVDVNGNPDEDAYNQALIDDLRSQATTYVNTYCLPQVNYTLKANLEKITDIGDTIQVIDERLGINLTTNVIAYDYDCILEKYTEVEFGNFTAKLSSLMSTISTNINNAISENNSTLTVTLADELQTATNKIWNALGSSYCIYEGDKILIVDTLPADTATNVIMINNGGIGFSNTGINGTFSSAWTIDNVLNMENINVINLTANLIKGGTLKLGSALNQSGTLEVYDLANNLIAVLDKDGLKMYGNDGSYIVMNNTVGFAGYDRLGNKIYWVDQDEFHQKKSVVEEEITIATKMRMIPIQVKNVYNDASGNSNSMIINDGIGVVATSSNIISQSNMMYINDLILPADDTPHSSYSTTDTIYLNPIVRSNFDITESTPTITVKYRSINQYDEKEYYDFTKTMVLDKTVVRSKEVKSFNVEYQAHYECGEAGRYFKIIVQSVSLSINSVSTNEYAGFDYVIYGIN